MPPGGGSGDAAASREASGTFARWRQVQVWARGAPASPGKAYAMMRACKKDKIRPSAGIVRGPENDL